MKLVKSCIGQVNLKLLDILTSASQLAPSFTNDFKAINLKWPYKFSHLERAKRERVFMERSCLPKTE